MRCREICQLPLGRDKALTPKRHRFPKPQAFRHHRKNFATNFDKPTTKRSALCEGTIKGKNPDKVTEKHFQTSVEQFRPTGVWQGNFALAQVTQKLKEVDGHAYAQRVHTH